MVILDFSQLTMLKNENEIKNGYLNCVLYVIFIPNQFLDGQTWQRRKAVLKKFLGSA